MVYREEQKDGSTWVYNPLTDVAYTERPEKYSSSSSYVGGDSDYSEYKQISRELERKYSIDPNSSEYSHYYKRIMSMSDSYYKTRLEGELNGLVYNFNASKESARQQNKMRYAAERQNLIQDYKSAWNSRNALWRLFHQKYNPKKRTFDDDPSFWIEQEIEEIRKR